MKCPFCETEFDISTLQSFDDDLRQDEKTDDMNWQSGPEAEWTEGETDNMRVYVCKSCGGEIIGDKDMGASSCPYCGNSVIVPSQFKGDLKPDILIPQHRYGFGSNRFKKRVSGSGQRCFKKGS